jgi:hypothetical protein
VRHGCCDFRDCLLLCRLWKKHLVSRNLSEATPPLVDIPDVKGKVFRYKPGMAVGVPGG